MKIEKTAEKTTEKLNLDEFEIESFECETNDGVSPEKPPGYKNTLPDLIYELGYATIRLKEAEFQLAQFDAEHKTNEYRQHLESEIKEWGSFIPFLAKKIAKLKQIAYKLYLIRQWTWEIAYNQLNNEDQTPNAYIQDLINQIRSTQAEIDAEAIVNKEELDYYYQSYLVIKEKYALI